jgi:hypothetical protein
LDVDGEGGADCGEQAGLRTWLMLHDDSWTEAKTHENQGGVEILVVLLHGFAVELHCLSLVHVIEIKRGVVVLDRLEVHPEGLLDAILESARRS